MSRRGVHSRVSVRTELLRKVEIPIGDIQVDDETVGRGGFGMVRIGRYKGRAVAVKQVLTQSTDVSLRCLRDEAKILIALRSDFIVSLLGVVLEGGYSLVLEFMTQGNLLRFLKRTSVRWPLKGRLLLDIINGMSYLHANKIIHQDLKPENVLLDDHLNAKISDFGTSVCKTWTRLSSIMETQQRETAKSKLNMGTLAYMAPERLGNLNAKVDQKTDVYSFAILMWVVFTDKEPYEDVMRMDAIQELIKMNVTERGQRPDLTDIPGDCPYSVTKLMMLCWNHYPYKRPSFEECHSIYEPIYKAEFESGVSQEVRRVQQELGLPVDADVADGEAGIAEEEAGGDAPPDDIPARQPSPEEASEAPACESTARGAPDGARRKPTWPNVPLPPPEAQPSEVPGVPNARHNRSIPDLFLRVPESPGVIFSSVHFWNESSSNVRTPLSMPSIPQMRSSLSCNALHAEGEGPNRHARSYDLINQTFRGSNSFAPTTHIDQLTESFTMPNLRHVPLAVAAARNQRLPPVAPRIKAGRSRFEI